MNVRSTMRFHDREEAGELLGRDLARRLSRRDDVIVLALPRGGVPVGFAVAQALDAPLDVFIVRKLGVPGHEELAMGAIASGGVRVLNREVLDYLPVSQRMIDAVAEREQQELERREREYRGARPPLDVKGKTVIVVDDGLATGSTMRAAVAALRKMEPRRIIIAVPVAAESTCNDFRTEAIADEVVCLRTPEPFQAVGLWYSDFTQTTDDEVHELLDRANAAPRGQ
jgi:putative phosphoribosyl transferase